MRMVALIYYDGLRETPARLLEAGLLLPVIDGLDEIPEAARRAAVGRINEAFDLAQTEATGKRTIGALVAPVDGGLGGACGVPPRPPSGT
jgi:hypothetical protein